MLDDYDGYSPSHDKHPEPKPTGRPLIPFPLAILIAMAAGFMSAVALWQSFN